MTTENGSTAARLTRIETALADLAASTRAVLDRLDIMQAEVQRSATQLHRLGLNQESAKHAARRQEEALADIVGRLEAISQSLATIGE